MASSNCAICPRAGTPELSKQAAQIANENVAVKLIRGPVTPASISASNIASKALIKAFAIFSTPWDVTLRSGSLRMFMYLRAG
eukprot:CAMPEP_0115421416 /NCGR_PEP_ID=MMETSP0271-20121206/26237_1 /TAXON_ID=71861 /ORGANISM="Scrippsiella trochoidea, Strain CCMP3099" /LENGTH=82 /DNA_ID=CAMNT_0002846051 /DNA_START=70 /DNA_END=314 /DNA_ORIENTATION=+